MQTLSAERMVRAEAPAIRSAIAGLVASVWGPAARTLVDEGDERIDAIAAAHDELADDEADVWLTWLVRPAEGGTLVRLVLDEVESGPDASSELDRVLLMLADRVSSARFHIPEMDA